MYGMCTLLRGVHTADYLCVYHAHEMVDLAL